MLYDKKWDKPSEPRTFEKSLDGFISWLETKEPNEQYRWSSVTHCACAQFGALFGISAYGISEKHLAVDPVMKRFNDIAHGVTTFGALLEKARAARDTDGDHHG